jgi:hypothetical protein
MGFEAASRSPRLPPFLYAPSLRFKIVKPGLLGQLYYGTKFNIGESCFKFATTPYYLRVLERIVGYHKQEATSKEQQDASRAFD